MGLSCPSVGQAPMCFRNSTGLHPQTLLVVSLALTLFPQCPNQEGGYRGEDTSIGYVFQAYSLGDLEDTLEPIFFFDSSSSASNISSSSTQQEMGQMLGSQVTVTGPEEDDKGHQVPALTGNLEPMEEQAEAALVLVEAPIRGPPSPPSDRELELDKPAVDDQGQHPLLALQSALHLERNPEPLFFSQIIWLFVFIICVYYSII
uniref:uncharacterized protein LOC120884239 isoform X1 n=1 Tax=Ictidomys tridecemlineatus TaxID=43179 RepID=UPI001A9DF016|nr:uncharacterized protein LOC120884239 isoform X1 [Ictidomys tridecemlineatus]